MSHDRWGTLTRRAAIALLPWLCLATANLGCSPTGQESRAAGTPDRLKKMRASAGPATRDGRASSRPSARTRKPEIGD